MNALPGDWSDQLRASYPKRSGPCGWGGIKLMLAVRTALRQTDWDSIMKGVRGYATYCDQSGKAGSEFVKAPLGFFEEGVYLEELTFQIAIDPKVADAKRKEAERWSRAIAAAAELRPALEVDPRESIAVFETRIALARDRGPARGNRAMGEDQRPLLSQISILTERMRMAK